jgi:hypothetical protein
MKRRKFVNTLFATTAVSAISPIAVAKSGFTKPNLKKEEQLSCYYFRGHMYTMVPRHVREDLKWMADHGTDAVDVAIIEQDLVAAVENVEIIANEAEKLGMKLFIVPSRWAGLVAGAPKVPSMFAVHNPQTWLINPDGKPSFSGVSGVNCSVFYPEVADFFKASIDKAINLWNIKGIIWDEPKIYNKTDHSKAAIEKLGKNAPIASYNQAFTDFWSDINSHIKTNHPQVQTNMFLYANMSEDVIESAAGIKNLDCFGCDGRPWGTKDSGVNESHHSDGLSKTLLDAGERFLPEARKHHIKTLWLVENHNMRDKDVALMDKRFPEVLEKDVDHLIYYYYPRNLSNPEENMSVIGKHIRKFK